jgi:cytochrome P450
MKGGTIDLGAATALIEHRDPVEHKRCRKTWDRGMSTASIKNYDEILTRKARELVEQSEKRVGQEVDLAMWMGYYT